ncbi:MAG: ImmA/IrrE family metallo-endopeptidase [Candidatus Eisenbacteria bacterium]|nr:ImmA/IrrE family metallo-endopeptidase [Candidatus Eisenbacteria bacterium]
MSLEHPRARGRARQRIAEFGIQSPEEIDLEALAAARNVLVREAALAGAQARLVRRKRGGVIRVHAGLGSLGQKRFCVAHELGHLLLHEGVDQLAFCSSTDMLPGYRARPEEPEANAFAADLLMPERMFLDACRGERPTFGLLAGVAESFRVTLSAMAFRYVELGVRVCAVAHSEEGHIRWSKAAGDFRIRLREWGSRLDGRTRASDFFGGRTRRTNEEDVPAEAWLDDHRVEARWTIRGIMIPMPTYDSTLSLLWVVDGSELDACGA